MAETSRKARSERARRSLDGLRVGDAFGERHFGERARVLERISARELPPGPWRWTDDTAMALSVFETLENAGCVDQDDLARRFASRYMEDPCRGYGGGVSRLLQEIARGADWRGVSRSMFNREGSWGNGSAMRAAPVGAWFADDPERAAAEGKLQAEPTHSHPEGIAGSVAVAVAASIAAGSGPGAGGVFGRNAFFEAILDLVPASRTRDGIAGARGLEGAAVEEASRSLGSGHEIACFDTVPFCLWVAAENHDNYEEALWMAVRGLGDQDTVAAIVGGVVALSASVGVPADWLARTEGLPAGSPSSVSRAC